MFALLLAIAPTFSCYELNQLLINLQNADNMTAAEKHGVAVELFKVAPPDCEINICDYL